MDQAAVLELLVATGEEVRDEGGNVIGYFAQPAVFKVEREYLARGGFVVVTRDEETGRYAGTEFDALKEPRTRNLYPAGHSEKAWEVGSLQEALHQVMAYFPSDAVE